MSSIWFDKEASEWTEALPVGNGFLGAMVFGGAQQERIQLNEDSLWSAGPMDRINPDALAHLDEVRSLLSAGKVTEAEVLARRSMLATYPHMRHYQTLGDVWIDFSDAYARRRIVRYNNMPYIVKDEPEYAEYRRELDLATSVGTVRFQEDGRVKTREFFASAPDNVIAYRIESPDAPLSFELSATRKDNRHGIGSSYCDGTRAEDGDSIVLTGRQGAEDGIGFALRIKVLAEGGKVSSFGSHLVVEGASAATVLITARTTFRSENPEAWCAEALASASEYSYEDLRKRAVDDYRQLFNTFALSLSSDAELAALPTPERLERLRAGKIDAGLVNTYFDYARYLLISSSRPGSLPATLQGIWNEDFEPAWGSKYTININIEMIYWLAEKAGLSGLHLPLIEHLERMVPAGRKVAREMYGARGFCCHHNTDIWGDCAPADMHLSASIWPMGAAWLSLHLAEHWRYTHDAAFARRFYPVLREAVLFFIDYMVQDQDGYWVSGPSASPENTYEQADGALGNLCMGPTMDTEILRELFSAYLEMQGDMASDSNLAPETSEDSELVRAVRERLDGLRPIRIGARGQICEWSSDYDEPEPGHRHISQLFALYPAAQIRPDITPDLARAAEATLESRLSHGGGHTGWSKAWIILFYDRLGRSEKAWENLTGLLANATLPNLFDNHPPFQIDGNFGGAMGVLEMIVRDYGDATWLLPALPEALATGSLHGMCLACGAVLDMEWCDGRVAFVHITGGRDGTARLHLPDGALIEVPLRQGSSWSRSFEKEER